MMDTYEEELEAKIARYLIKTVAPVFIIFGTVGNLLSILVMSRRKMRSSNAAVYLITLAIADTGSLYIGLLPVNFSMVNGEQPNISEAICKIASWLVYVTLHVSTWILVAFTIERFLSICFPFKAMTFCTQKSSIISVMGIVIVMSALNGHVLYGYGKRTITYGNVSVQLQCMIISYDYNYFLSFVYPWIDLCFNCFVPVIIIIACNSCIAIRVRRHRRNMQQVFGDKNTTSCNRESLAVTGRQENPLQLTIMLFTVTIVFLISTAPIRLYFVLWHWFYHLAHEYNSYGFLYLIEEVIYILLYLNNSVNFILYCITGSIFRNEVRTMFGELRNKILNKQQNPTNIAEKIGSRRPSLIARQILTELPHEESLPLQILDNQ